MFSLKEDLQNYTSKNIKAWQGFLQYMDEILQNEGYRHRKDELYLLLKGTLFREKIGLSTIYYLKIKDYIIQERFGDILLKDFAFTRPDRTDFKEQFLGVFRSYPKNEAQQDDANITAVPVLVWIRENSFKMYQKRLLKTEREKMEQLLVGNESRFMDIIHNMTNASLQHTSRLFWGVEIEMKGIDIREKIEDQIRGIEIIKNLHQLTFGLTSVEEAERFVNTLYNIAFTSNYNERNIIKIMKYFGLKTYALQKEW